MRSSVDQDHVVLDEQEVAIPPIPVIMKQEVRHFLHPPKDRSSNSERHGRAC